MPAEYEEFISKIDERFSKDRNGFFLEYVHDEIIWNIVGFKVIRGRENFIGEMKRQELENHPIVNIKNIIIEGEYIIVESTGKAVNKAGKPFNPAYCDIYRLKDGKIQELTTYIVDTGQKE